MTTPVSVYYLGGSGGHLLSHLILLSGKHFCQFQGVPEFQTRPQFTDFFNNFIHNQWNNKDKVLWKKNEFWPDNIRTECTQVGNLEKFYLTCGKIPKNGYQAKKVLLYTDIDTQIQLARYKQAWIFYQVKDIPSHFYQLLNDHWLRSLSGVKDPSWPVLDLCDFDNLPDYIKKELFTIHKGFEWCAEWSANRKSLDSWLSLQPTGIINNDIVFQSVMHESYSADVVLKLQDIVKSRGQVITQALDLDWHESHGSLVDSWLKLHPSNLQNILQQ